MTIALRKKLIEVALPLEAINKAAAREKSIRHGHPSTLHLWWARRPLAAARAVIFAQMVDDPDSDPAYRRLDGSVDEERAGIKRAELFNLIEELVKWENTNNDRVINAARAEIARCIASAKIEQGELQKETIIYGANKGTVHPNGPLPKDSHSVTAWEIVIRRAMPVAVNSFLIEHAPPFHDPFAGGGALPLEAQRLGLVSHASDLNPVAVMINKAMIEIPPKFAGLPPVNPEARKEWKGVRNEHSLSGDHCLAKGDGGGSRGISAGAEVTQRGDLRYAIANYTGSSVSPGKHCRGMDKGVEQGESAISGDCAGLVGGDRDSVDSLRTDRLVPGANNLCAAYVDGRGQPDADNATQEVPYSVTLTSQSSLLFPSQWPGATGLAEDVRYYGKWMRDEAEKRIGCLYPKAKVTPEMAQYRPDLKPYVGRELTVIAWLWARTVESSNPAYRDCHVPLISSFWLSKKKGREAWVEIEKRVERSEEREVDSDSFLTPDYSFLVRTGKPQNKATVDAGTKLGRGANFRCVLSDSPLSPDYIKAEGVAGRMGSRLMAIVCEGDRGRVYLPPIPDHEKIAQQSQPKWKPEQDLVGKCRDQLPLYGMNTFGDLFTSRQLVALTTFSDLVPVAREKILEDLRTRASCPPINAGSTTAIPGEDNTPLRDGGIGLCAYAEAVSVYLGLGVSRLTNRSATLNFWDTKGENVQQVFARQALAMNWDYVEGNPFSESTGNFRGQLEYLLNALLRFPASGLGVAFQQDASIQCCSGAKVISTDPPYYDNICYADLSDFFYIWMRRSMQALYPELFGTLLVPKAEELVATPYRHGSKDKAEAFFLDGMTKAVHAMAQRTHESFPVTIYYAFKQAEGDVEGTASTGWETFLGAVIRAGFAITGTWPMRTEYVGNLKRNVSALASSIILVCRPRPADAPMTTRKDLLTALRKELPPALRHLQQGNIAPVDLAQASIGPGMAVFSRYSRVLETDGTAMTVRTALQLINQILDETLAEQEGDYDAETAWAVAWFDQFGFNDGPFGDAETLSKAKNTALNTLTGAGIVKAGAGKARLLRVDELPVDWNPKAVARLTVWESVHHLIRVMNSGGESGAAELVAKLGGAADAARELAYRLYSVCERRKRAAEALAYNSLVQSWPEISRLAREVASTTQKPLEQEFDF